MTSCVFGRSACRQPAPLALRLLTRRDYTTAELRDKLTAREYSAEDIDEALRGLAVQGLLDDGAPPRRTCARRAESKGGAGCASSGNSRRADWTAGSFDRRWRPCPPRTSAPRSSGFCARRRLPAHLAAADRRRLFQQLLRRGFTADLIASALKERESGEE